MVGTVVEDLLHHPQVMGLSPVAAADTRRKCEKSLSTARPVMVA
jgi:hypothetical protein